MRFYLVRPSGFLMISEKSPAIRCAYQVVIANLDLDTQAQSIH